MSIKSAKSRKHAVKQTHQQSAEFPKHAVLKLKGRIACKIQLRSVEDFMQFQNIVGLTTEHELLDDHMQAALDCDLHQEGAGQHDWRVTMLGRGMRQLWDWMHRLALEAKNPNVKNQAGRILGEIYHLAATSKQVKKLREANPAFLDQVRPHKGRKGGKPIAADLKKWGRCEMEILLHIWFTAMRIAYRARAASDKSGEFLEKSWVHYFKDEDSHTREINEENALSAKARGDATPAQFVRQDVEMLRKSAFKKLTFAQLNDFKLLWDGALERHLKETWEAARKAGKLWVKGDDSFMHRFGDSKHPGAGYYLAEHIWESDINNYGDVFLE